MPPKGSRKRVGIREGADEAGPAQRQRSSRSAALQQPNLDEAALPGEEQDKILKKQAAARLFWESFDGNLLAAWLKDFKENPLSAQQLGDRALVIDTLVDRAADRPAGKNTKEQLATMRVNFNRIVPNHFGPPPGMHVTAVLVVPAPAATAATRSSWPDGSDVEMEDVEPVGASSTPVRQLLRQPLFPLSGYQASVISTVKAVAPASGLTVASSSPPPILVECESCTIVNHEMKARWICSGCHLRGDLKANDPTNVVLLHQQTAALSARSLSGSSSIGQSSQIDTSARIEIGLSALDRGYIRLAERGGIFPLFAGPAAGAPISHLSAIAESRKAPGATATEAPSEYLIALIRAGKLTAISHAIPRPLAGGTVEEDVAFAAGPGGSIVVRPRAADVAANLESLQQFCRALFSTILPSLIDRPAALMQWVALGRTALELEARYDWNTAAAYLAQLLNERVTQHLPFADLSQQCLASVQLARGDKRGAVSAAVPPHLQGGNLSGKQGPAPLDKDQPCGKWNVGACTYANCRYKHSCKFCGGAHRAMDTPSCAIRLPKLPRENKGDYKPHDHKPKDKLRDSKSAEFDN